MQTGAVDLSQEDGHGTWVKSQTDGAQVILVDFQQDALAAVSCRAVSGFHKKLLVQKFLDDGADAGGPVICQVNDFRSADGTQVIDDV